VSDDEVATDSVDDYRRGRGEWLVSVKQVTEGTDIKRLHVLCYLTVATTEMSFRQLIGRISRVRFQDPDSPNVEDESMQADLEAYVFLPADPRLIGHAKNIEQAQLRALRELTDEVSGQREMSTRTTGVRMFLGSEHKGVDTLVIGNKSYAADEAHRIQRIASFGVKMETAAKIFDSEIRGTGSAPRPSVDVTETQEDRIDKARRECNKAAFRYAKLAKVEVKDVHYQWPPQKTMGLEALQQKHRRLLEMLSGIV
jgi:superfamily II DNA or RNA helicase